MSGIPREAADGFERGAADYERGRPGYPAAAVAELALELGIEPGRRVVDVAAGTGKLTRALTGLGAELVAVEPVAAMRAQLIRAVPGAQALPGTAECLPLADGSVDAVVVAQAFHWFDVPRAAAEMHRVLAPGGGLGIVRNEWDESVPWVAGMRELIARHAGQPPRNHARDWRDPLEATGLFDPLRDRVFDNPVVTDMPALRARVASISYVALMDDDARSGLLDAVAQLVRAHVSTPTITVPYATHLHTARASTGRAPV